MSSRASQRCDVAGGSSLLRPHQLQPSSASSSHLDLDLFKQIVSDRFAGAGLEKLLARAVEGDGKQPRCSARPLAAGRSRLRARATEQR